MKKQLLLLILCLNTIYAEKSKSKEKTRAIKGETFELVVPKDKTENKSLKLSKQLLKILVAIGVYNFTNKENAVTLLNYLQEKQKNLSPDASATIKTFFEQSIKLTETTKNALSDFTKGNLIRLGTATGAYIVLDTDLTNVLQLPEHLWNSTKSIASLAFYVAALTYYIDFVSKKVKVNNPVTKADNESNYPSTGQNAKRETALERSSSPEEAS